MEQMKTVKISGKNYTRLSSIAGQLQQQTGRITSVDRALTFLLDTKKPKISDLAGSWKMDDLQAKEFYSEMKKGWKTWKSQFA